MAETSTEVERQKSQEPDKTQTADESFYSEITAAALDTVIQRLHKRKATGIDQIHNMVIKQGAQTLRHSLLRLLNRSWVESKLPEQWTQITQSRILPIPKCKAPTRPKHFRPISLLSAPGKIMETIIKNRLSASPEAYSIISEHQAGFRKHRNTLDQLILLQQSAHTAFARKQHLVLALVLLDMEKAYDRAWRAGILYRL